MIDTHTHIYLPEFDADRIQVISRARQAGVTHMILPNIDVSTLQPLKDMMDRYAGFCSGAIGLHPTSVDGDYREGLERIGEELTAGKYAAIGEIGIDLYWDKTFYKEQTQAFETQLKWAEQMNLPVIIHARESLDEIIGILDKMFCGRCKGVFHSFTGTAAQVRRIRSCGDFLFGINGIVTFKNSLLPQVLPEIGIDSIVLETDAPYLSPVPYRGKRNEPAYLPKIGARVGEIFGLTLEETEEITNANAQRMFCTGTF